MNRVTTAVYPAMLALALGVIVAVLAAGKGLPSGESSAGALRPLEDPPVFSIVGHYGGPGGPMAVDGDLAFVGVGARLMVFDISDPQQPAALGGEPVLLPAIVNAATVDSGYAFVTWGQDTGLPGTGGISVLDVSDPSSPVEVGSLGGLGGGNDLAMAGDVAYVAGGAGGLRFIDLSDPSSPVEVGSVNGNCHSVAAEGTHAYALCGSDLVVIDASNPESPRELGRVQDPLGVALGLAVVSDRVYTVGTGSKGHGTLVVYDVSNPSQPGLFGYLDNMVYSCRDVALSGSFAYVAALAGGLRVVDITDPAAPQEVGAFDPPMSAYQVVVAGSHALVTEAFVYGRNGFRILDISSPASPDQVASVDVPVASDVAVSGSLAYLADYDAGLWIMDVTDPENPATIAILDIPAEHGGATAVAVDGDHAYVVAEEAPGGQRDAGLWTVDVSDPYSPQTVGVVDVASDVSQVVVDGDYAYLAGGATGLWIVDVSSPSAPSVIGRLEDCLVHQLQPFGGYAYLSASPNTTESEGLIVVDVSDPSLPEQVGFLDLGLWPLTDVAAATGYVYATHNEFVGETIDTAEQGVLRVLDVSNPSEPQERASVAFPGHAGSVALDAGWAFVADGDLRGIDISDPANPQELFLLEIPEQALLVKVAGELLHVLTDSAGVMVVEQQSGGQPPAAVPTARSAVGVVYVPSVVTWQP